MATTRPRTTVLAGDTTGQPQTTAAGDAPADTFDTAELASSVTADKEAAARAGYLSVNAVTLASDPYVKAPGGSRTEKVYAWDGKGVRVTLDRDIVTGATTVAG